MGGMKQSVHPRVVGSLTEKWQFQFFSICMKSVEYRLSDLSLNICLLAIQICDIWDCARTV